MSAIRRITCLFSLSLPFSLLLACQGVAQVADSRHAASPAAGTVPASADEGRKTYNVYCIRCHGVNMESAGAVTYDLRLFPADQKDRFMRSVRKGKGGMPPWESVLKDDNLANLWAYVMSAKVKPN